MVSIVLMVHVVNPLILFQAPIAHRKGTSGGRLKSTTTDASGSQVYRPRITASSKLSASEPTFLSTKKDKRVIKHSAFVNRIEKVQKKSLKRRRPNKKLVTNLESLADALPGLEGLEEKGNGEGKIKQKTVRTRPGAMKRREKAEKLERERFDMNMAQLMGTTSQERLSAMPDLGETVSLGQTDRDAASSKTTTTQSRWAALRGFIAQTMEQKEEFCKS